MILKIFQNNKLCSVCIFWPKQKFCLDLNKIGPVVFDERFKDGIIPIDGKVLL